MIKWAGPVLAVLSLLAWGMCLFLAQEGGALSSGVLARWAAEEGVSPVQMERAERYAREDKGENVPRMTLWREKKEASFRDEGGERSASGAVLELLGEGGDLWPAAFINGGYPPRGDTEGIAVDEALSAALWGGVGVPGQRVRWGGRSYCLRGVFRGSTGLALVQGSGDDAEAWPNLLLRFPEGGGREEAQNFLNRNGWSTGALLDLPLLSWGLGALAGLPGLVLLAGLLAGLLRRGLRLQSSPLLLLGYLPGALAAAALALWCWGWPPQVPQALLPTKWSDFDFWTRMVSGHMDQLRAWLAGTPTLRDLRFWPLVLGCLLLSIAAAALTVLAAERVRPATGRGVLVSWAAALLAELALVLVLADRGGVAVSRAMLLLPVLWPLYGWGLARHEAFLKPVERGQTREALEEAETGR